ncbi:dienelactone hydrolase family protein [Rhodococcus sp. B7740]|uniref:dienelactone hydrolase family protein n=1 Tax=Rhodococcus sp. B7740 TaxID=1564114 RepID=UPI0006966EA5|nr:dienelactone hydrolase family protein [Rhodococcus sp. B7740]
MPHPVAIERRTIAEGHPFESLTARPSTHAAPTAAVMVVHDITGSESDIVESLRIVAQQGYLAVAPLLYTGGGSKLTCMVATMRSLAMRRGPAFEVIELTRTAILDDALCNGEVAIVGFCMGGGFALLEADRRYVAAAAFYGYLTSYKSISEQSCPVVASFGSRDPLLPRGEHRLRRALDSRGVESDIKTYPGVGHGFANHIDLVPEKLLRITGFGYNQAAATDAWTRVFEFLSARFSHNSDRQG